MTLGSMTSLNMNFQELLKEKEKYEYFSL
jgi:hypothetical protein